MLLNCGVGEGNLSLSYSDFILFIFTDLHTTHLSYICSHTLGLIPFLKTLEGKDSYHTQWMLPMKEIQSTYVRCMGIVQFSHSVVSDSLRPHELQHARLPCPSTPEACSNLCPLSR